MGHLFYEQCGAGSLPLKFSSSVGCVDYSGSLKEFLFYDSISQRKSVHGPLSLSSLVSSSCYFKGNESHVATVRKKGPSNFAYKEYLI